MCYITRCTIVSCSTCLCISTPLHCILPSCPGNFGNGAMIDSRSRPCAPQLPSWCEYRYPINPPNLPVHADDRRESKIEKCMACDSQLVVSGRNFETVAHVRYARAKVYVCICLMHTAARIHTYTRNACNYIYFCRVLYRVHLYAQCRTGCNVHTK